MSLPLSRPSSLVVGSSSFVVALYRITPCYFSSVYLISSHDRDPIHPCSPCLSTLHTTHPPRTIPHFPYHPLTVMSHTISSSHLVHSSTQYPLSLLYTRLIFSSLVSSSSISFTVRCSQPRAHCTIPYHPPLYLIPVQPYVPLCISPLCLSIVHRPLFNPGYILPPLASALAPDPHCPDTQFLPFLRVATKRFAQAPSA